MAATFSLRSTSLTAGALALCCLACLALPQTRQYGRSVEHTRPPAGMEMVSSQQAAVGTRPQTTVKPLSCEPLSDLPGKAVTTALVTFPPNAYSPRHRHPGSVTAYVLQGVVRSQLLGGEAISYSAGQTWFEPPGVVHLFAENPSPTEPAQLLAIFIADENCGPLVIPDGGSR